MKSRRRQPRQVLLATGSNSQGQLGIGHDEDVSTWTPCHFSSQEQHPTSSKGKGKLSNEYIRTSLREGARVIDLRAGAGHAVALVERPVQQPQADGLQSSTSSSTPATRMERVLYVSGSNARGQLSSHFPLGVNGTSSPTEGASSSASQRTPSIFCELPTSALVKLAGLPEYVSVQADAGASPLRSSSPSDNQSNSSSKQDERRRIQYEPKAIACAWETTFVALRRTLSRRPGSLDQASGSAQDEADGDNEEEDLGDVLLSFGANDHGELGIGEGEDNGLRPESGKVHVVDFPRQPSLCDTESNYRGYGWTVQHLAASQRHVVAVLCSIRTAADDSHSERAAGEQIVVGWGASRHGQLNGRSRIDRLDERVSSARDGAGSSTSPSEPAAAGSRGTGRGGGGPPGRRKNLYPAVTARSTVVDLHLDGDNLVAPRVKQIALGASHTLLLLDDRRVIGLGSDVKRQIGEIEDRYAHSDGLQPHAIGCTWNGSFVLSRRVGSETREGRSDGDPCASSTWRLASTGSNTHGQLGRGSEDELPADLDVPFNESISASTPLKIVCGSEHGLLLISPPPTSEPRVPQALPPARLVVWGWNEHGNLGLGDVEDRYAPVEVRDDMWRKALADTVADAAEEEEEGGVRLVDCWAGCGTSWVVVEVGGERVP